MNVVRYWDLGTADGANAWRKHMGNDRHMKWKHNDMDGIFNDPVQSFLKLVFSNIKRL